MGNPLCRGHLESLLESDPDTGLLCPPLPHPAAPADAGASRPPGAPPLPSPRGGAGWRASAGRPTVLGDFHAVSILCDAEPAVARGCVAGGGAAADARSVATLMLVQARPARPAPPRPAPHTPHARPSTLADGAGWGEKWGDGGWAGWGVGPPHPPTASLLPYGP